MKSGSEKIALPGQLAGVAPWLRSAVIITLGLYSLSMYLLVLRPMTSQIAGLEAELVRAHRQIAETGVGYPENPGEALRYARSKLDRVRQLADRLSARLNYSPEMEYLLSSPFRVLEFEQRRFDIQQSLTQQAEASKATLPGDLFAGLPSYDTTTEQPQLLWVHLEFFNHVLASLLTSGQHLQIEQIETLPIRMLGESSTSEGTLFKIQLRLKVRGSPAALAVFLNASLPGGELTDQSIGEKGYSIDRLDLQRSDANEQVRLDTRLTGFILSEQVF